MGNICEADNFELMAIALDAQIQRRFSWNALALHRSKLIAYTSPPLAGPRHDSHILQASGFNMKLRDAQDDQPANRDYVAYCDTAFTYRSHDRRQHKRRAALHNPLRQADNTDMKSLGASAE